MTGNLLIDSAISLVGIAALVVIARLLFPAPPPPITVEQAADRLGFDEPDFQPTQWFLDQQGESALAVSDGDEACVMRRLGRDLVTRRFKMTAAMIVCDGERLVISLPDHTAANWSLTLGDEAAQAAALLAR